MKTLQDPQKIQEVKEYYEAFETTQTDYFNYWLDNTFGNWDYWLSLSLTVLPWAAWFIIRKKQSQARLLLAGSFIIIVASWLDFLGIALHLWYYTGKAFPTIPSYVPWDFSLLPVAVMLWLQYRPNLNPYLKAVIFAAAVSFIAEPLFEFVGLYQPVKWNHFYSFPIYILIYLVCYRIIKTKTFDEI